MTTTPITPAATGRRVARAGAGYVVYTRTFRAPIDDVWASVTESERLERWIGTWTGDPSTGEVSFLMNAEGEDVPVSTYRIDVCEAPRRLVVRTSDEMGEWLLELDLAEAEGTTTLTFAQAMHDAEVAENVGPGWDYYLDRLVTVESGGDVAEVDFDQYYPRFADHYRAEFA